MRLGEMSTSDIAVCVQIMRTKEAFATHVPRQQVLERALALIVSNAIEPR
jgi:hypothetical protein